MRHAERWDYLNYLNNHLPRPLHDGKFELIYNGHHVTVTIRMLHDRPVIRSACYNLLGENYPLASYKRLHLDRLIKLIHELRKEGKL